MFWRGIFKHNKPCGFGVLTSRSWTDDYTIGEFNEQTEFKCVEGHKQVQNINLRFGLRYTGGSLDGKLNGPGYLNYLEGGSLNRQLKNGKIDGSGIISFANGDQITGNGENGEFSGSGKRTYLNGDVYEGQFFHTSRAG